MRNTTAAHASTATCCVFASAILGTFTASVIVAKARIPSTEHISIIFPVIKIKRKEEKEKLLTDSSNDLRLQPILILKSSSKDANPALSITTCISRMPNMIEHLSRREEEHGNQAHRGP